MEAKNKMAATRKMLKGAPPGVQMKNHLELIYSLATPRPKERVFQRADGVRIHFCDPIYRETEPDFYRRPVRGNP